MSTCTYEFPTVSLDASDGSSATFESTSELVGVVLSENPDIMGYFTSHVGEYLTGFIWPLIFLAYLILAFLPTSIARCCCPKLCCKPVEDNVIPGYPACGCCGFMAPTFVWLIVFVGLCVLTIYCPFAFGALGSALAEWVSVVCGLTSSFSDLFGQITGALDGATSAINSAISGLLTSLVTLVDQLAVDVEAIQTTMTNITDSLVAGCSNVTSSAQFQELQSLTASIDFDCNDLSVGTNTETQVDSINSTLQTVRDTINDFDIDVGSFVDEARSQIDTIEDEITAQLDGILTQEAGLDASSLPVAIPFEPSGTLQEVTESAAAGFPSLMALLLLFNWLGLAFWLLGFLLISCVKGSAKSTPRSQEVKNGCCGRCSMKMGCICSYWAGFLLCFTATLVLLFAFALNRVVDFYYYAPYNADEVLSILESTGLIANASDFATIVQGCFFEEASLTDLAALLGFNVSELIDQLTDQEFSLTDSFDLSDTLDSARSAVASGKSTMVAEKYTTAQVAAAERAATYCCDYEALFEVFASDCSSVTSVCFQCQSLANAGDCTDPTPCSPTAAQNGGASKNCNDLAKDALWLINSKNSLIEEQEPKMDSITSRIDDIDSRDLVGTADGYIQDSLSSVSTSITTELDSLTCSEIVDIYYGIYDVFLNPVATAMTTWGSVMAAIIGLIILLVYVSIPVNVRLGNDGIDLNNLDKAEDSAEQPSHATSGERDVAIEMVGVKPNDTLPVAEVVHNDQGARAPVDNRSPQYEYNNEKIDEYGGNDDIGGNEYAGGYNGGYPAYGGTPRV